MGVPRIEVDAPEVLHVTYAPLNATAPERTSDHVLVKRGWGMGLKWVPTRRR